MLSQTAPSALMSPSPMSTPIEEGFSTSGQMMSPEMSRKLPVLEEDSTLGSRPMSQQKIQKSKTKI